MLDCICRAYFFAALNLAAADPQSVNSPRKSRVALLLLANSFWGTLLKSIVFADSNAKEGRDELFREELKSLATRMIQALESIDSWQSLYEVLLEIFKATPSDSMSESAVCVSDSALRLQAVRFSEILFNACYVAGGLFDEPTDIEVVLRTLREQYQQWLNEL